MDDIPRNPLLTEELCVSALTQIRKWLIALMPAIKQHLDKYALLYIVLCVPLAFPPFTLGYRVAVDTDS